MNGLEEQGLASFAKSWDELIASVTASLRRPALRSCQPER